MTTGSFLMTGNMDYLRRPFVRNVKRGDRVLVLSDTSHDARVWQVVQSILSELGADVTVALFERRPADYYDPPAAVCESMMTSDINVLAGLDRHAALSRQFPRHGGRHSRHLPGRRHDTRDVPVGRRDRRHETDRGSQALCRQGCLRTARQGLPGDVALRHGVHLSRRRPYLRAAAADRCLRSLQDHQLRQGRKPQGRQSLLLPLPHRRIQRRPDRRQRQRPAGHRLDDASPRPAVDADRAHGRERAA